MVLAGGLSGGTQLEGEQLRLGHLLDREADALAAQAGALGTAEAHGVDAVVARVADYHPAVLELLAQPEGQRQVVGEHARLQAKVDRVGDLHRLAGRVERDDDANRPVDLLAVEARLPGHACEERRQVVGALAAAAGEEGGAPGEGIFNQLLHLAGGTLVDHGSHVGRLVELVAHPVPLGALDEGGRQLLDERPLHQDPLGGKAVLAGRPEGTAHDRVGGVLQVGVAHDEDGGVVAKLHRVLLEAPVAHDLLASGAAARERHQSYARVTHQRAAHDAARAGHHLQYVAGHARLPQRPGQAKRAQWRPAVRLHYHGIAAGDGRPHLVGNQVQRVVERRDRSDDPDGFTRPETAPVLAAGRLTEVEGLAPQLPALLGRHPQRLHAPAHLLAGLADGLDAFAGDGLRDLLRLLLHPAGRLEEHAGAFVCGRPPPGPAALDGTVDGGGHLLGGGLGHLAHEAAVLRIEDPDGLLAPRRFPCQSGLPVVKACRHAVLTSFGSSPAARRPWRWIFSRSPTMAYPVSSRPAPGPVRVTSPRYSVVKVIALVTPSMLASG